MGESFLVRSCVEYLESDPRFHVNQRIERERERERRKEEKVEVKMVPDTLK